MKLGKGVRCFVECSGSFGETPPVYKDFAKSAWAATTPPPRQSVSRYGASLLLTNYDRLNWWRKRKSHN